MLPPHSRNVASLPLKRAAGAALTLTLVVGTAYNAAVFGLIDKGVALVLVCAISGMALIALAASPPRRQRIKLTENKAWASSPDGMCRYG